MLTPENVDLAYQKALAALNATIRASDATKEEVELAKKKRNDLTKNFIDQALADSAALTAQFQQFIGEMEALIAKFDPATTIAGIVQLKDVVDEAAVLVLAATTDAPLAGGAAGMHAIASTSGAVPAVKASTAPKGRSCREADRESEGSTRIQGSQAGRQGRRQACEAAFKGKARSQTAGQERRAQSQGRCEESGSRQAGACTKAHRQESRGDQAVGQETGRSQACHSSTEVVPGLNRFPPPFQGEG